MGDIHLSIIVSMKACIYMLIWFLGNNSFEKFTKRAFGGVLVILITNILLPTMLYVELGIDYIVYMGLFGVFGVIMTYLVSWV